MSTNKEGTMAEKTEGLAFYDGSEGELMEPRWQPGGGWVARVFYYDPVGSLERLEPGAQANTFRCPDPLLADQPTKEGSRHG